MTETLLAAKTHGDFEVLRKWRNELLPVYGPRRELLMSIERAGIAIFGIMAHGVCLNAYVQDANGRSSIGSRNVRQQNRRILGCGTTLAVVGSQ